MKSVLAVLTWAFLLSAHADQRDEKMFEEWARNVGTGDFEQSVESAGLSGVVPLFQLLRTASDWKRCGGPAFEIPPAAAWPEVNSVLSLVKELKRRRILTDFEVVSTYRNTTLNACSRGVPSSAHTRKFAIDLILRGDKADQVPLCNFWRTEGKAWKMGLSRYPSGRIHLDTDRYRSWGSDRTRATSYCNQYPSTP